MDTGTYASLGCAGSQAGAIVSCGFAAAAEGLGKYGSFP